MFAQQARKNSLGSIEMEKHEAVVSGIMSTIGFDTLELSDQTIKAGTLHLVHCVAMHTRTMLDPLGLDLASLQLCSCCCMLI